MTQFYSRNDVNYSGDVYSIPFDYIDKKEVKVYIDDELWTKWHFLNKHQLTLDEVPEDIRYSNIISVRRETDIEEKVVTYDNNSLLTKENLNKSQDQLLFAVQEIYDNNTQFGIDVDNILVENKAETEHIIEANKQEVLDIQASFEEEVNTTIEEVREAASKVKELESAVDTAVTASNTALNQASVATNKAEEAAELVIEASQLLNTTQNTVSNLANKDLSNLSEQGQAKFDEKVDLDDMYEISIGLTLGLFDTILKDHVLTYEETKGLALQGTYVYKEALAGSRYGYPDFYAKVIEEYNQATTTETVNGVTVKVHSNGHKFYNIADKTAIDEFFNTMGTAWFYGVDTANERIFLPRNNYFDQVTGNASEVGLSVEAGLPNITGTLYSCGWADGNDNATGAFYNNGSKKGASGSDQRTIVNLDASRSSSIYKNDVATVQPNAVKKLLYICVGNTTNYEGVTDVVNQGMEILEQVNQGIESRVAKDSMQEVPCVIETYVNGSSWYRIWSDNWCEQGGDIANDDVTITLLKPFANTNYTCLCVCSYSRVNENFYIDSKTTTTFHARYASGGTWFACGQLAEGEY